MAKGGRMGSHVELLGGAWDPRVLAVRCGETVQAFAVVTRELLVVVDTLLNPASGRAWRELLEPIRAHRPLVVVNTHADWDHYWGNQEFRAPILGTRACARRVRDEGSTVLERMRAQEPERFGEVRLVGPNLLVDCDATLEGGDLTLQFVPTPGHQPDQIAVWIPELKLLLAGDAAEEPFPLVDDPGGLSELRRSLQRLLELRPEWVMACHAPPERGCGLLERNLAYFDRLEMACRQAGGPPPADDEQLAAWAGFPEEERWGEFYRRAHRQALRAMLS